MFSKIRNKNSQKRYLGINILPQAIISLVFSVRSDKIIIECLDKDVKTHNEQILDLGVAEQEKNEFLPILKTYKLRKPIKAVIGISSGIIKNEVFKISYTRRNPKKHISKTEIETLLYKVKDESFNQIKKREIGPHLLSNQVLESSIDGQIAKRVEGGIGAKLSFTVLNTYMPIVQFNNLKHITNQLGIKPLAILCPCLSLAYAVQQDAIYLDIQDNATEIVVQRKGIIQGARLLSLGKKDFRNNMALWVSGIFTALEDFELLPNKIMISGPEFAVKKVIKILKSEEWPERLPFAKSKEFIMIRLRDMPNIIDQTGQLDKPDYMASLSLSSQII